MIIYLLVMFFTNMSQMNQAESTMINAQHGHLNLTQMGPLAYGETHMKFVYTIQNEAADHFDSSELSRYFNITFQLM